MKPSEHKTVQARILAYAQEIGWTFVSREEAERRRVLNHKERRDRKEGLDSDSLSSLWSLAHWAERFPQIQKRNRGFQSAGSNLIVFPHSS